MKPQIALKDGSALSEIGHLWDSRYASEGEIWGHKLSATGQAATRFIPRTAKVFEVGYGYGRDLYNLAARGYKVSGIEASEEGYKMAASTLRSRRGLLCGDFLAAAVPAQSFDAVISHRVLHLITDEEDVRHFVQKTAEIIKPGGFLFIGARDSRDFNSEQMIEIEHGVAEYKHRPGHIIKFWDQARFEETFSDLFDMVSFYQTTELESAQNKVDTHLTIMAARRKAHYPDDFTI